MKLISINVGLPREVVWKNKSVTTGIFKDPVAGSVKVNKLNLEGDKQADLTVHGGIDKAIYLYPAEHYAYWQKELPKMDLPWGMFGENFTTLGLLENSVNIGDRFRIGSAEFMVTEPRMPCYKLGIRFGRPDIVKRFLASRFTGFYFQVLKEGDVKAGDEIKLINRDKNNIAVLDITRLYADKKIDLELVQRATQVAALPESWRDYLMRQAEKAT